MTVEQWHPDKQGFQIWYLSILRLFMEYICELGTVITGVARYRYRMCSRGIDLFRCSTLTYTHSLDTCISTTMDYSSSIIFYYMIPVESYYQRNFASDKNHLAVEQSHLTRCDRAAYCTSSLTMKSVEVCSKWSSSPDEQVPEVSW